MQIIDSAQPWSFISYTFMYLCHSFIYVGSLVQFLPKTAWVLTSNRVPFILGILKWVFLSSREHYQLCLVCFYFKPVSRFSDLTILNTLEILLELECQCYQHSHSFLVLSKNYTVPGAIIAVR